MSLEKRFHAQSDPQKSLCYPSILHLQWDRTHRSSAGRVQKIFDHDGCYIGASGEPSSDVTWSSNCIPVDGTLSRWNRKTFSDERSGERSDQVLNLREIVAPGILEQISPHSSPAAPALLAHRQRISSSRSQSAAGIWMIAFWFSITRMIGSAPVTRQKWSIHGHMRKQEESDLVKNWLDISVWDQFE